MGGKLKQLTSKSRQNSLEDSGTANILVTAGIQALLPGVNPGASDLSLADADVDRRRQEKRSVKSKITGIFKSLSRNNSVERSNSIERNTPVKEIVSSSAERPLQRPPSLSNLRAATHNLVTPFCNVNSFNSFNSSVRIDSNATIAEIEIITRDSSSATSMNPLIDFSS